MAALGLPRLCGEVYTAAAPEGVGEEKYDASCGAMVGMLKYGTGLPSIALRSCRTVSRSRWRLPRSGIWRKGRPRRSRPDTRS